MTQNSTDPDPYAELDNRADAGELSEEFRKPQNIRILRRRGLPSSSGGVKGPYRQRRI